VSSDEASPSPGTLWIVATPIGTLGDFAPRAREVLAEAALILAEDTRRAGALLGHIGIAPAGRLKSHHEHNENARLPMVLEALRLGRSVVLMSDAGTPVLSDPGFVLVRAAREEGLKVATVPGPSSFTAALAASGQPPLPATLVGFLPARAGARRSRVAEFAQLPWTLVVLLSPHRLGAELADLAEGLGSERPATLLVELSKMHERAVTATLGDLAICVETERPRGEYVVVIGPPAEGGRCNQVDPETVRAIYDTALAAGMGRTEAMKSVAAKMGIKRRDVFDYLVDHETEKKN
jgi:16S rRNA (cytidine1402-2'-O)-methyltransferase